MKRLIQIITILLFSVAGFAQVGETTWIKLQPPLPYAVNLTCVFFTSESTGFAVGWHIILKTTDGGINWSAFGGTIYQSLPDLYSVFFTNPDHGFAVGGIIGSGGTPGYTLVTTVNGGVTWSIRRIETGHWLRSVFFPDSITGYAVGEQGFILKTNDGGVTWTQLNAGITKSLYAVFFTNINTGYITGADGTIMKTTDGGTTWASLLSSTPGRHLLSIFFTDTNTGYLAGSGGTIYKTINAGASWTKLTTGLLNSLNSIYFTGPNTGYAAGNNGVLLQTNDAGATWSYTTPGGSENLTSVFFPTTHTGYAVGGNGTLLKAEAPWGLGEHEPPVTAMSFTVFPDPADDRITIEMNRNSDGWTGATILSIQGKTMVHRMFKDQDIFVVDVASLPAGLYFIRIQTADGVATRKLFIR